MNIIRICTVVTGKTLDEFVRNLDKIQKISDLIELRVDYIDELKISDIDIIKSHTMKPAVFTCRKQAEGGMYKYSEKQRKEIIQKGLDLGFDYVDIEYSTFRDNTFHKNTNTKIILSYHNFDRTPAYWELTKLIFDMHQCKADIIKIATKVDSDHDVQVILRALLSKKPDDNQILIGMGEKGKITRILGPLLGSYLTYTSTEMSESAPGQIKLGTLQSLYNTINSHI